MEPHERRAILILLGGYLAAASLLAALFFAQGALWALYGLLVSPLGLAIGLWLLKRFLESPERSQLPTYLASRSLHAMVNEWNEALTGLQGLERDWGVKTDVLGGIEAIARALEPNVGRVKATGYWQPRRRSLRRLPLLQLQAAQAQWNELRVGLAAQLNAEVQRRAHTHADALAGLRTRGLATVLPQNVAPTPDWKRVLTHLEGMRNELRLAAQEALNVLGRTPSPPDTVLRIRDDAQARLGEDRPADAVEALLRLRPAAPAPSPPRGKL